MAINLSGINLGGGGGAASATSGKLRLIPVDTLPDVSVAKRDVIYIVPAAKPTGDNKFDEYVVIDTDNGPAWEPFGRNVTIDLSGYATKTDLEPLAKKTDLAPLATKQEVENAVIKDYSRLNGKPSINGTPLEGNLNLNVMTDEQKQIVDGITGQVTALDLKLSELDTKTNNIEESIVEDNNIIIADDNDNIIAQIDKNGSDFKNLKSGGKTVLVKDDIPFETDSAYNNESIIFADNEGKQIVAIDAYGVTDDKGLLIESPKFVYDECKITFERFARWKDKDDCLIFPILTDLHPQYRMDRYRWVKYLIDSDKIFGYNFIAHLGDVGDCLDTVEDEDKALNKLSICASILNQYNGRIIFAQGNHDGVDPNTGNTFNRSVIENYMQMPTINRYPGEFVMNNEHQCGYWDDVKNKIRVYTINTSDIQPSYFDTHSKNLQYYITKEQMQWFADMLQKTPDGYNVLVLSHWCVNKIGEWTDYISDNDRLAFGYTEHALTYMNIMEAFASKTNGSTNGVSYDFRNVDSSCKLIGNICGDSHMDASLGKNETKTVKKNVGGVISNVQTSGNGVNYVICQGYGGITEDSTPSFARHLTCNPMNEFVIDVCAIKPLKREMRFFRIGKGGADYDRMFNF